MYRVPSEDGCQVEPFPSAFRREAREQIAARLGAKKDPFKLSPHCPDFLRWMRHSEWPANSWTNLNTPEEFTAFEALHGI